jgi:hypothetical protein
MPSAALTLPGNTDRDARVKSICDPLQDLLTIGEVTPVIFRGDCRLEGTETLQELRSVTVGQQCIVINDVLDIGCRPVGAGSITSNAPLPSKSKKVDNYTGVTFRVARIVACSDQAEKHPSKIDWSHSSRIGATSLQSQSRPGARRRRCAQRQLGGRVVCKPFMVTKRLRDNLSYMLALLRLRQDLRGGRQLVVPGRQYNRLTKSTFVTSTFVTPGRRYAVPARVLEGGRLAMSSSPISFLSLLPFFASFLFF